MIAKPTSIAAAVDANATTRLERLLCGEQAIGRGELTSALRHALLKKSDSHARCIALLLRSGADPNAADGNATPVLHTAVDSGCTDIVRMLVDAGCDVDRRRRGGAVALHCAARRDHVMCARLLLAGGARHDAVDAHARTPLLVSAETDSAGVLRELLRCGADTRPVDRRGRTALHWTAANANVGALRALLASGVPTDAADDNQLTALMLLAQRGDVVCARCCTASGADVDVINARGDTALLLAARAAHSLCARHLATAGANVNVADSRLVTPLVYLLHDCASVTVLLAAGADPDRPVSLSECPLGVAVTHSYEDACRLLLQANCAPGGVCGKRPLQVALYGGDVKLVKMIYHATVANESAREHLRWLCGYLRDENVVRRSDAESSVGEAKHWLAEVTSGEPKVDCLLRLARRKTRALIGGIHFRRKVKTLPLPKIMKDYLLLTELNAYID